jgi:DNA-directed RNA polymerase specialized sigma24 family protein
VIVSPGVVGSPDGDAKVIGLSWDEPERFAAIFGRYFAEIRGYLARRVGVRVADGLAGEVFLAAFAQRKRYGIARGNAGPWLCGIAASVVGSHRRHERRFYDALARTDAGLMSHDEGDRVAGRVSAPATRPALASALAGLARGDRDVVLLVALAGLGYQEVAGAPGIPCGTVCSRLNRARRQLRESLGGVNPAAAAAITVTALVPGGTHAGPAYTGAGPGAALTGRPAGAFLLAVAKKAAHQATGRYWCAVVVQGTRELIGAGGKEIPAPLVDGATHAPASAPAG